LKEKLVLVYPHCEDERRTRRLNEVLDRVLDKYDCEKIQFAEDFRPMLGERILFAIPLGVSGVNLEYYRFLKKLRMDETMLEGSIGAVLVDGESEMYTKSVAREFMFSANRAGCLFPGRGMVEGTRTLQNFNIQAMNLETNNLSAYMIAAEEMVGRMMTFQPHPKQEPKILVLHASNHETSNTVTLWHMVKKHLRGFEINEISLRNGTIMDCEGCPYHMCLHFSEQSACYYGGVISEDVYPAIVACDALVLLCPNYNDAVSANLAAFINRLTALFRRTPFYDKHVFALVVSGYSGGNIVAEQVISALSVNKTFCLPSRFSMVETANAALSVLEIDGIEERARVFAKGMKDVLQM